MDYVFNEKDKCVTAWGFLPFLAGINEAVANGFVVNVHHPHTGADYHDFSFTAYLEEGTMDLKEVKKQLFNFLKTKLPEADGRSYRDIPSLIEKLKELENSSPGTSNDES